MNRKAFLPLRNAVLFPIVMACAFCGSNLNFNMDNDVSHRSHDSPLRLLLWDAAIEEPCFVISWRLYRKSLQWSQSRLLFPGPNGAPLSRAALHNALRRLNAGGERNSSRPITPEKIRAAFLWRDPLEVRGIRL